MNDRRRQFVATAFSSRRPLALALLASLLLATGCTTSSTPPPANQLHIETVAGWFQYYRAENGMKPPPNEQVFTAFIQKKLQERGQTVDINELLTSPRDGQKYVINYKPNSNNAERNVAVYEKEGYGGKRWISFESKWSEEVDDAKLQEHLARK